ncbi:uncharacterized protein [Garra rufa]|uniref:uncharacterized protein isoform X2 n=1 Tax=Garra rufa TaxID=137080 RepID=UPI003CCE7EE5
MRTVMLLLMGCHLVFAKTHSLKYFYTAVSGDIDFPEFTVVGLVDDLQFMYFDSNTKEVVPKTEWIRQNVDADYWDRETQTDIRQHHIFKNNIQVAQVRFNQSTGVHTLQLMYGCELDDDGSTRGYIHYGYDGEDFISLDKSTLTWIAAVPQAMITKIKWDSTRVEAMQLKAYLENTCIEWLQKYVGYGKDTLERKVSPQVFLQQKSSSSQVTCHATGFYPEAVTISWHRNGQDQDEDVDIGELLPNEDGTFQKSSTIRVTPDEWKKNEFSCVVKHQGKTFREIVTEGKEDCNIFCLINKSLRLWLQKDVGYGKDKRKVSPQVFLQQKSSSSQITCHATGFYPKAVTISWQRNGQDHDEDVDLGELLPNEDGTFQRMSTLRVTPDDLKKNEYSCVVEHQGKTFRKIVTDDFKPVSGTHSLKYFYTAVSGDIDFPEFTVVGLVDDLQFMYFDSNTKKVVPKTEWIRQNVDADYWDRETQTDIRQHQIFKNNIQIAKERFNQSTGIHIFQQLYGCEWDDQTGATNAIEQFGFDGEDFVFLDFKELRFITPVQQGIPTTHKWNNNRALLEIVKHYYSTVCIEWLRKYLQYGKSSLEKTVSPQVSLLQKSPSSPVTCHATGFYPSGVTITWMRNGQQHHEDVDLGELLPNEDGTFQKTSTIRVTPDEWKKNKFICVVEHRGKTKTANEIRTNNER